MYQALLYLTRARLTRRLPLVDPSRSEALIGSALTSLPALARHRTACLSTTARLSHLIVTPAASFLAPAPAKPRPTVVNQPRLALTTNTRPPARPQPHHGPADPWKDTRTSPSSQQQHWRGWQVRRRRPPADPRCCPLPLIAPLPRPARERRRGRTSSTTLTRTTPTQDNQHPRAQGRPARLGRPRTPRRLLRPRRRPLGRRR